MFLFRSGSFLLPEPLKEKNERKKEKKPHPVSMTTVDGKELDCMTEQIKIMDMINKGGYLNLEQISLLLNKNIKTIQLKKEQLVKFKMLNVDTLPKKNYYTLTN